MFLHIILLAISILFILIIVLQNPKDDGMKAFSGEKSDKANMKQRGIEKVINNVTCVLAILFFVVSLVLMIIERSNIPL